MTSRRNIASNSRLGDNGDFWAQAAFTSALTLSSTISPVTSAPIPELATGANMDTIKAVSVPATNGQSFGVQYDGAGELLVSPGQFLTVSAYGRTHTGATAPKLQAVVVWLNASNAEISRASGTVTAAPSNTWTRFSVQSGAAPALTVRARVLLAMSTANVFTANDTVDLTGLLVEPGASAAPAVGSLFIPGITAGAYWDGATEGSPSTLYAFGPATVTTTTDPPTAHIVFDAADLADEVATVTLYELHDGTQRTVRSAIRAFALGGIVIDDLELPRGTTVTYKAEAFRADGSSVGFTPGADVVIPGEVGIGYLSDPLDPATPALRVEFRATVGVYPKTDAPGATYRVGLRTVALLAQRGLLKDVDLSFYTSTLAEYQTVQSLINQSNGLLLFRVDPPVPLPRLMYFWAKGITWDEFDQPDGLEDFEWDNVADQISPIEGEALSSLIPWQVYIDAFPTWADFNAAYLTWLDAINNPPEA